MADLPAQCARAGYVGLAGRPNVGKSTLLNHLVGQKISITSRRPQTTRSRILGIASRDDAQIVLVDLPGIQHRQRGVLPRAMNRIARESLAQVDAVCMVVEALTWSPVDQGILELLPVNRPTVLAINKVDLIRDKRTLLPHIAAVATRYPFRAIVPISAREGTGLDGLSDELARLLPESTPAFGADALTDRSERFLAAELLREKLFRQLGEELPYSTAVEIERFEVDAGLRRIWAAIWVDKPGQKAIVIGKDGGKLKVMATQARHDMERLFGGKVFLEVWVKVKPGWVQNPSMLRRLGYE
jgi:GTP-binding protein Era